MNGIFYTLDLSDAINQFFTGVVARYGDVFHRVSAVLLTYALNPVEATLKAAPPIVIIAIIGAIAWLGARRVGLAVLLMALTYVIGCLGLWDKLMATCAIMVTALILTTIIGVPSGIAISRSQVLARVFNPVLDMMQTLPSFVYLIPVVMLFGLGRVPAIFATMIYALPPLVRLTDLGLRQVPEDVVEASRSFGATSWQQLIAVELPLAMPSIMTGVNQAVMMSLAMVVIASMIGARGLGEDVLSGINNLDMGQGILAGAAIVILAIVFDRITQSFGVGKRARRQVRK
ncbi:ABC transporter permease subunit [Paraburkholderia sp. BL10I2N1]|uniref:ABC transporter permease n=1 Tax=Paraburkholderia sp. BL10I2N1 TaxID=1938796 RepID=UPI00105F2C50|nr:ABC transporter permease subunit [Paraburkholderia sp. BL10I2N1]TDN62282.1 glycine betaine/proline transport system permease protein [Paraburkholderia sp. BL10I2N1]